MNTFEPLNRTIQEANNTKYKLASHDTFTYLPVRCWWMNLIKWTAKCQDADVTNQLLDVDMIDVRVRFDKNEEPYFAHGIVEYKCNVYRTIQFIDTFLRKRKIYCRIMLEQSNPTNKEIALFVNLCHYIESTSNIIPFGGMNRYDWSKVYYKFKQEGTMSDRIEEQISSVRGIGIFPWLWAKLYNKEVLAKGTDKEFLMIDFV